MTELETYHYSQFMQWSYGFLLSNEDVLFGYVKTEHLLPRSEKGKWFIWLSLNP